MVSSTAYGISPRLLRVLIPSALLAVAFLAHNTYSLNNGLVRRPPMGWMSWTKFLCEIDCERHPFSCINEQLYRDHADRLAEDGYLAAGYEFIHIDDCWSDKTGRDTDGRLTVDKTRFPSGMKSLADYLHQRGLKLGVYADYGNFTCAMYPGSFGHLEIDATTFAEWGADYLKLDGCNVDPTKWMHVGYPEMSRQLNATGRSIVYSCSWPAYLIDKPHLVNYTEIAAWCNLWRNYDDIEISWRSIMDIIAYYNANQEKMATAHGPGNWNDPDMIIVGSPLLTVNQSRAQMSIWAIWSAPLIMSNDLRTIGPEYKEVLLNERVIAIDQDPLGIMGRMIYNQSFVSVYVKEMTPIDTEKGLYSYAIAVLNNQTNSVNFESDLQSLGLTSEHGYDLLDLWDGEKLGRFKPSDVYRTTLAPASVVFVKATLADMADKGPNSNDVGKLKSNKPSEEYRH